MYKGELLVLERGYISFNRFAPRRLQEQGSLQ